MFDIGFWELAVIAVVALLVVGPDRLPGLARTVGLWVGRIRRYVSTVRDDIEREIQADELKKMLEKSNDLNPLQDVVDETTNTIGVAKKEIAGVEKEAEEAMSNQSAVTASASGNAVGDDDETGADPVTPDAAATTVGEAMSARDSSSEQAPAAASEEAVENTQDDEQRAR